MEFYDFLIKKAKEDNIQKIVVGAIIPDENGKILILTRPSNDFMGGIDELPSGNMELNENLLEALAREVKEETNLILKDVIGYICSFDYISSSGKKARQYNFVINVFSCDNIVLSEHEKYKWESIENIRNNNKITDEVKMCIEIYNFNK